MKQHVKYAVVVLVYRNADDLLECIESVHDKIEDCKIIVVNSYFDDDSMRSIESIARNNHCDFINIENRGYSYGNNCGIAFANNYYDYDYLIISNPDIVVKKFNEVIALNADIIAPKIIAKSGKNQNPMHVYENKLSEWFIYHGFKKKIKYFLYMGIGLNKLLREICICFTHLVGKKNYSIYTAHGSFLLLSANAIKTIGMVYDEKMFLFAEEEVLAYKAKKANLRTVYTESIEIMHKEDGSMKLSDFALNEVLKDSNIYYYEHYRLK